MPTPLPIPIPIPVAFGPHEGDWWMVAITALAAAASIAVAVSAFVTSSRAQATANASEAARTQAEKDRADWEYRQRFEDALVEFMRDVGEYLDRLAAPRPETAKLPSLDPLHPSSEILILRARGEDLIVATKVRQALSAAFRTTVAEKRRTLLADLVSNLRAVVDGSEEKNAFNDWIATLETKPSRSSASTDQ